MTPSSSTAPELKMCPFCSGQAEPITMDGWHRITCKKCKIVGPMHDTESEAIAVWNHRPESDDKRRLDWMDANHQNYTILGKLSEGDTVDLVPDDATLPDFSGPTLRAAIDSAISAQSK